MKFFSAEHSFCFGCSVNTPETEIVTDEAPVARRRSNRSKSTKHWRPTLTAIAEDGLRSRSSESAVVIRSEKKPLNKAKSQQKTRSHSFDGDYRKSNTPVALPVFSPTPFLF